MDNSKRILIVCGKFLAFFAIVAGIIYFIIVEATTTQTEPIGPIDASPITTINMNLLVYEGKGSGKRLKKAINTAKSINESQISPDGGLITVNGEVILNDFLTDIVDDRIYTIEFDFSDLGYVNNIKYQ